jgi:hypothetical protein
MDYHLKPVGKQCAATGQELSPGAACYSAVVERNGELVRLDYSPAGWNGPPADSIGHWKCVVPEPTAAKTKILDADALLKYFEQMTEDALPGRERFRYVLATTNTCNFRAAAVRGRMKSATINCRRKKSADWKPSCIRTWRPNGADRLTTRSARMTRRFENSSTARCRPAFFCALAVAALALPGCHYSFPFLRQNQFGPALPHDATQAEIIGRVNENIAKIHSWRSDNVHISGGTMMPIRVGAQIAVEAPRNFRLNAGTTFGEEADFGSNDEQFWFWVKRSEMPYVFLASHEQMGQSEILRQIPFQPDWLMEVLGVVPLKEEEFTLSFDDTAERTARLKSERLSPSGQPVQRVIRVDTRYGLIREQSLYDSSGRLIAKAYLNDHRRDAETGVILPRLVQIEWPQPKPHPMLKLNIEIGDIEVNPSHMPSQMWEVPEKNGFQTVDLGKLPRTASPHQFAQPAPNRFAGPSREPLEPLDRDRFVMPVHGEDRGASPGKVRLRDQSDDEFAPPGKEPAAEEDDNLPEWARHPIPSKPSPNSPSNSRQRTPSSPEF